MTEPYFLPGLVYELHELMPRISTRVMRVHYEDHHGRYVKNLNNALKAQAQAIASNDLLKQLELQPVIKFNAGGHINHLLFWENIFQPLQDRVTIKELEKHAPNVLKCLLRQYGSFPAFQKAFETAAINLQGNGWVWLVKDKSMNPLHDEHVSIITTKDEDIVPADKIPLLAIDMWEHAYDAQYLENRKKYLENIWEVICWYMVEQRFAENDRNDVFEKLRGLAPQPKK